MIDSWALSVIATAQPVAPDDITTTRLQRLHADVLNVALTCPAEPQVDPSSSIFFLSISSSLHYTIQPNFSLRLYALIFDSRQFHGDVVRVLSPSFQDRPLFDSISFSSLFI